MNNSQTTITILIPAYNESKNLIGAVEGAVNAVKGMFKDYEIIILEAFSKDDTGIIADELAKKNKKIKVIHRDKFYGFGTNYMEGVKHAKMEYFAMFPGDNENSWESLRDSFEKIGKADIIVPYTLNQEVRAFHRQIVSKLFVGTMNFLFNLNLKYYTGNAVYRTELLKKAHINSQDFAYNAEILVKLIKSGHSYTYFGIKIKPTNKTVIFKPKNIISILRTVLVLFYEVHLKDRKLYQKKPVFVE